MKKQLLFAAMLTLTAAPAAAQIFDINQTETVSSDLDLAMYELNSLIETSITKIQATYDIIKQKDPENSVLSALDYNLQLIKEIETEAQSKYELVL